MGEGVTGNAISLQIGRWIKPIGRGQRALLAAGGKPEDVDYTYQHHGSSAKGKGQNLDFSFCSSTAQHIFLFSAPQIQRLGSY
jgi:hypothetical protein